MSNLHQTPFLSNLSTLKGVATHSERLVHARRLFVIGGRQPGGCMLGRHVLDGEARAPRVRVKVRVRVEVRVRVRARVRV